MAALGERVVLPMLEGDGVGAILAAGVGAAVSGRGWVASASGRRCRGGSGWGRVPGGARSPWKLCGGGREVCVTTFGVVHQFHLESGEELVLGGVRQSARGQLDGTRLKQEVALALEVLYIMWFVAGSRSKLWF